MEMLSLFLIIAGVFGAAGIALAAAGAHAAPSAGLDSAANILLFHALAILGGTALLLQGMLSRQLALIALAAWALGTVLFSADVVLRAFVGQRLFPMAAPTGGIILVLAWLVLAAAALARAFDHSALDNSATSTSIAFILSRGDQRHDVLVVALWACAQAPFSRRSKRLCKSAMA